MYGPGPSQNFGLVAPPATGFTDNTPPPLLVNRAPVLTLWAAVVAQRLGHPLDTALTLARAIAGSTARLKVRIIGREDWKPLDSEMQLPPEQQEVALVTLLGKTVRLLPDSEGDLRAAFRTLPTRDGVLANELVPANRPTSDAICLTLLGTNWQRCERQCRNWQSAMSRSN